MPGNGSLPNLAAFKLRGAMKDALEARFKRGIPADTVVSIEIRFGPQTSEHAKEADALFEKAWWAVVEKATLRGFDARRQGTLSLKNGAAHEDGGVSFYLEWSSAAPLDQAAPPALPPQG